VLAASRSATTVRMCGWPEHWTAVCL
jgi:hypothetical protein